MEKKKNKNKEIVVLVACRCRVDEDTNGASQNVPRVFVRALSRLQLHFIYHNLLTLIYRYKSSRHMRMRHRNLHWPSLNVTVLFNDPAREKEVPREIFSMARRTDGKADLDLLYNLLFFLQRTTYIRLSESNESPCCGLRDYRRGRS